MDILKMSKIEKSKKVLEKFCEKVVVTRMLSKIFLDKMVVTIIFFDFFVPKIGHFLY